MPRSNEKGLAGVGSTPRVRVEDYNPRWALMYLEEESAIRSVLGEAVRGTEHFGSTSVPGLAAKPIVDIMLGLKQLPVPAEVSRLLGTLGYEPVRSLAVRFPGLEYFHKGPINWRLYHLHVVEYGGSIWIRYVTFRDLLRRDAARAAEYAELKRRLARDFQHSRELYTEGKRGFVDGIVGAWTARSIG